MKLLMLDRIKALRDDHFGYASDDITWDHVRTLRYYAEMLKRPEGATVEQIAAATGWQDHAIRGAISGALKKKLGLTVEATRMREVGPNQTGAKGSATTYRIVG